MNSSDEDYSEETINRKKMLERILAARNETNRRAVPQRMSDSSDEESDDSAAGQIPARNRIIRKPDPLDDDLQDQRAQLLQFLENSRSTSQTTEYTGFERDRSIFVIEDCEEASKDPDLLALYNAGNEQKEAPFKMTESVATAARVLLPGRFVDYLLTMSTLPTDPLEIREKLVAKMNRDETVLSLTIARKLLALYIRDHPDTVTDELKAMYGMFRMFTSGSSQPCSIL